MLNLVSRILLALTVVSAALAGAYFIADGDRTGVGLLAFLALGAFVGGLSTAGNAVPDVAPQVAPDAPPPGRTTMSANVPAGSGWPLAAAVSLGVLAIGAVVGLPLVLAGILLVLVATVGWFALAWSEHPTWTAPVRRRVSSRLLSPIGLPVGGFLLVATIAVSTSRILLAVSKDAAWVVAILAASAILAACYWIASRPRLGSSVIMALSVLAATSMVGAGIAGAVGGERRFEEHTEAEKPLVISAQAIKFSADTLRAKADQDVTLEFVNKDAETFHNFAVYAGSGLDSKPIFNGEGFPGDGERRYEFHAPPPGTYNFVCDFHPSMKGTLVIEGGS